MYKLTIAVTTYNRANLLVFMLDSILQQTYKDFYVIISDNCSIDNTKEAVKPYLSDSRFEYIKHEHILKEHFNYLFDLCKTEYLIIVHDDDTMHPDMIKEQVEILEKHKDASIVCTNINHINTKSEVISSSFLSKYTNKNDIIINKRDYINFLIKNGHIIMCPTVMFRMNVIKENKLYFNMQIGGACDMFLWFNLNLLDYNLYFLNNALYNYRIHDMQDSSRSYLLAPFLKIPVFNLLKENNYSNSTIKLWLKYVNHRILSEIKKQEFKNRKNIYEQLKDNIFLQHSNEISLKLGIFFLLNTPLFIQNILFQLKKY